MKFKIFLIICFIIVTADSKSPDYSPLNDVVSNLKKSYMAAQKLTTSNTLLQKSYNYYGYSKYLSVNEYAYDYVSTISYTTNLLAKIFGNFSSVSNAAHNYTNKFKIIQTMAQYALDLDLSVYLEGFPTYSHENYLEVLNDIANELNNLIDFLSSSANNVDQLIDVNVTVNSANILKYLPSPTIIGIWLNRIVNITNIFYGLISKVTQDFSATYTLFKSSDNTFKAIEKEKNNTVFRIFSAANNTKFLMKNVVTKFIIELKATFVNYFSEIPKTLNITIASTNASKPMQQISETIQLVSESFGKLLDSYMNKTYPDILEKYFRKILNYTASPRLQIFNKFMNGETLSNCSGRFLTSAEGIFRDFGGSKALFNCADTELVVFRRIQGIFNAFMVNANLEVNSYLTNFQKCRRMSNSSYSYTMQHCIENNVASLMSMVSAMQAESNNLLQMATKYFTVSTDRLQFCLADTTNQLVAILEPTFEKFYKC